MDAAPTLSASPPEHPYALPQDDDVSSHNTESHAECASDPASSISYVGTGGLETPDREALYAEIQPLVRRLLVRYGKTPELRRDLPGEIYCRFCRLVAEYNPERGIPIRPYVICKLQQLVFNHVRKHWRHENRSEPFARPDGSERDLTSAWAEDDPLQQLLNHELLDALPGAISTLPHRQRLVIIYRFFEGRSYDEIADQMGVKVASVRSLQCFALQGLRRQMRRKGLISG